jgi:hypothetical protein
MKIPSRCPACSSPIQVVALSCRSCGTRVEGTFDLCPACSLEGDDRDLLELFLRAHGNAKEVERAMGVSYPTVRARLDRLWSLLDGKVGSQESRESSPLQILAELRDGSIGVDRAIELLRYRGRPPDGSA